MPSWALRFEDLQADVDLSPAGQLSLALSRDGRVLVEPSRLGLHVTHDDLSTGLSFQQTSTMEIDESYTTVSGKRRQHRYVAREWTLSFSRGLELQVRLSRDGLAYRYRVSWDGRPVTVCAEVSEWAVPGHARAILLPYENGRCDYEEMHEHTTAASAEPKLYGYPCLLQVGADWVLLTESNLDRHYAGSRLRLSAGVFRLDLPDPYVTAPSPLVTPWRVAIVGTLATVVESGLVTDLAAPSRVDDVSWIRPGAAAWSWWSDGSSTRSLEEQKRWVDYAASQGWPYLLADSGWNKEWMPALIEYAAAHGVGVFLWTHWQHVDSALEHREKLALWKSWGAVGVKIDFTESDGQDRMRWFDSILEATARLGLMVVFHGGTIPRGTERTWPQFMTAEAVKGAEWIKPKPGKLPLYPATHYLSLAFTRNVQGPMDFTPCTFTAVRAISAGFELALSVIFESGIQHFADGIEAYRQRPVAQGVLARVPVAWDETRLLSGDPASHIVLARRRGDQWWVGAGIAGEARVVTVPLDFADGPEWTVEVYRDDFADAIVAESLPAAPAKLDVECAANGGFTLILRRTHARA